MLGKETQKLVEEIVRGAENKKASDIKVIDVSKTSTLLDSLVICGGDSPPQLQAIRKEIDSLLQKHKIKGIRWEGVMNSGWLILDLGPIVVHILGSEERNRYQLEDLWGKDAVMYHYS